LHGLYKLTYLHITVNCESLLSGHGKAHCAVNYRLPVMKLSLQNTHQNINLQ